MNSNPNSINNTKKSAYTEPGVPKSSAIFTIVFTAVFLFFGTMIPLPYGAVFLILGAAFTAKSFSVKYTPFPFLALIPPLVFGFFTELELVVLPCMAFLCGHIMFFILKKGGNKTTAIIGSTTFITVSLIALLCIYTYKNYGGISMDDFIDLIEDLRKSFAAFVNTMLEGYFSEIDAMPDSPQKTYLLSVYQSMQELYSDSDLLLNSFLYILPSIVILAANVFSYIAASVYYFMVREGSGHKVFSTLVQSQLTVSTTGVVIYGVSFFVLCLSVLFAPTLRIIGLNFIIIYLPALVVIGIKSIFNPEIRRQNKLIIGAAIFTLFFNPIFTLLLVGFIGANAVLTQSMLKFMKKHYYDDKK